jgi:APA family basic amino acid/polyamine antiporter
MALQRELGVFGATMMGMGSIVGTGVFVSIGIAAGIAGPAVILAIALAAGVATCNALSSAQLAAAHPVSGGTYEYGYKYLNPWLGFTAGWMFLCAKIASAATAALGFSGYFLSITGTNQAGTRVGLAVGVVIVFTAVVLSGIRQSNRANIVIVSITLVALGCFVVAGLPTAVSQGASHLTPFFSAPWTSVLEACALMFVAYTGYGRIATLGEEVYDPHRTIPRAILITLVLSALVYIAVSTVGILAVGADTMQAATREQAAPLAAIARQFQIPGIQWVVSLGAMTAMLGVLLNLLLGLSRVLLAMGRRRDMPAVLSSLNAARTTPYVSVLTVGGLTALTATIGSVQTTWSFSAFTVLIYYAITNLAALRLSDHERLFPRWCTWTGLAACLFLAFWVEWHIWAAGLGIILIGLLWHWIAITYRTIPPAEV